MKAYKGFNKDLTCRGFQYEEGKTFETDDAKLCDCGLHACERPLDVFNYYAPGSGSVYHAVELDDVDDERRSDDSKVCGKKITIGAKLSIGDLVKAQIEFTKEHCATENNDPKMATAGDSGAATSRGKSAVGENGLAVARGNNVRVKGGMGAVLVLAEEENYNCNLVAWKVAVVDGENIKADTWYCLKDGEFVEAE